MEIKFMDKGVVSIDEARIIFRNFKGEASQFNRAGDRNFAVFIDDEDIAEELQKAGWNVKIKEPKEEGDKPYMFLKVNVKFGGRPPKIYLESGNSHVLLNEETIGCLDDIDIVSVDMDIRPYNWEVNGNTGRSAYLQGMYVRHEVDRFEARFSEEKYSED